MRASLINWTPGIGWVAYYWMPGEMFMTRDGIGWYGRFYASGLAWEIANDNHPRT